MNTPVLIVIDMLNDFLDDWEVTRKERLVKAREQLELARQQVDRAGQELSDRVSESVALPPAWREKPIAW